MSNKKHIISLAGDIASGKSSVARELSKLLQYNIKSNGEYFRSLAKEHNMDVTEFNIYAKSHPEIDRKIEQMATDYSKTHDNYIIDARLGWYSIPESFKVYLRVDLDEAARRAFVDTKRKSTENFKNIEDQKQDIIRRFNLENSRYFKLYGIHKEDLNNYDISFDTTNIKPKEVAEIIKEKYELWLKI